MFRKMMLRKSRKAVGLFERLEPRYVLASYYVSPSGSDTNPGTLQAPLATINRGVELAQPGDSVLVRGGVYRESVTSVRSGTAAQPISISNYNQELVTVSASDVVSGPWTETTPGSGIYSTASPTGLSPRFWTAGTQQVNGTRVSEQAGSLVATVINDTGQQIAATRSNTASSLWNFFQQPVTWQVRGLSITNTGAAGLPPANTTAYFSIMTGTSNGYASDDSVNVGFNGSGRLSLQVKKDVVNSWGTSVGTVTSTAITGFDLTLSPASATSVNYALSAFPSGQTVASGQWAISQADWSDGGTGSNSYVQIFAQETLISTIDVSQRFEMRVGSYEIIASGTTVLRDSFDDGEVTTSTYYPAGRGTLSTGYDQIFVNGIMQTEARTSNKISADLLTPDAFTLTMSDAYQLTSTALGGKPNSYYAGARFLGRVGQGWAWQTAVVTGSSGNTVQMDSTTASNWWWPNKSSQTSNTGLGYLYGKLEFLDADGEWYLQPATTGQTAETLYLRIAGGANPSTQLVERKTRSWTLNINGHDNIIVSGLNFRGGAIRLNGNGLTLDNANGRYLSHYLTFSNGGLVDGGLPQGSGILLSGSGNTVRNSTIYDTAGSGIVVTGTNHLITRNEIYNVDYSGTYATGLSLSGSGHTATYNTIRDAGRDILRPTGSGLTVMYNDLSNAGRLALDLGAIYTFGVNGADASGRKTRLAYNWIHGNGNKGDSLSIGIYLDNFSRNYVVDHNVIYDFRLNGSLVADGVRLNSPALGLELYHNSIVEANSYNSKTFTSFPTSNADATFWTTANHGLDYIAQNNWALPVGANLGASFISYAAQDFRPAATSIAINPAVTTGLVTWTTTNGSTNVPPTFRLSMTQPNTTFTYREVTGSGVSLSGINDGFAGATPDNGAYEVGGAFWVPGRFGYISANAPTDINVSTTVIAENLISGSTVGSLQATDPDVGDPIVFSLVNGAGDTDNSSFVLSGSLLKTSASFNYESKSSYSIRLRATDRAGRFVERPLTISVADLPELVGEASVGDGTVQRSLVSRLQLTFDGAIDIAPGAFSLIQRGTGSSVVLSAPLIAPVGAQTQVTITFQGALTRGVAGALVDGWYQLTVDGTKISRAGATLDVNLDGIGGDAYAFGDQEADQFFALYGDTDGDGQVSIAEFGQFRAAFGSTAGQANYNAYFDYDGSGIGITDFGQFRSRFGQRLAWR